MSDHKRYRGGRAIAAILDKLGWLGVLAGIIFAAISIGTNDGDWIAQLRAGLPGAVLFLVSLIAITLAQLTRAALDMAIAMRDIADLRGGPAADATPTFPSTKRPVPVADILPPEARAARAMRERRGQDPAPKLSATKAEPGTSKVHPIFSSRPPRSP
ncbi:MAG: hypothetical protein AAF264_08840 [Pseudomonadota bacterium]